MQPANVSGTTAIDVPFLEAEDLRLNIAVGACRLRIRPGGSGPWVSGSYLDPTGEIPVTVDQQGAGVRISQRYDVGSLLKLFHGTPTFELALGNLRPYTLTLEGGASENTLDLGGLPLQRLIIKHGAGRLDIDFSEPNPEPMTLLEVSSGAGALQALHLANANFAEMRLEGGASTYRLDFGGVLQRDANVRVSTGLSTVDLLVPVSTAARIAVDTSLGGLDVGDGWTTREGSFWTAPAVAATSPTLRMDVNVALGALRLRIT